MTGLCGFIENSDARRSEIVEKRDISSFHSCSRAVPYRTRYIMLPLFQPGNIWSDKMEGLMDGHASIGVIR